MPTNYRKLFAIQKKLEQTIKQICPEIDNRSGIYFYIRKTEDENFAYIGKAKHLLSRAVSHLQGYDQRIDISLKKRGFKTKDNESGWELYFLHCPEEKLDETESYYIDKYRNAGYTLYNKESGGTVGKTLINERKPIKGYNDGKNYGRNKVLKELKEIIDKYLVVSAKDETKRASNALEKFWEIFGTIDENSEN